jgi:DNA-binding transcriptional ArsR family regulator
MPVEPDITRVAQTIGDPTRIRMLTQLMDGRALTAKELSYGAGVGPATGTVHLRRLMDDALVSATTQGRHKYFRLASSDVARTIEALTALARPAQSAPGTLAHIRAARFCYDHLAGRIAIRIVESLAASKFITVEAKTFQVTAKGSQSFKRLSINVEELAASRRKFAPTCLDWSERKDHIGGALGAALASRFLEEDWITRERDSRIVSITRSGRRALQRHFGINWSFN